MPRVRILGPLKRFTNGETEVQLSSATLGAVLAELRVRYGAPFEQRVFASSGELLPTLRAYLNGQLLTPPIDGARLLEARDELLILPVIGGG